MYTTSMYYLCELNHEKVLIIKEKSEFLINKMDKETSMSLILHVFTTHKITHYNIVNIISK